jgi:hypothetical protein
MGKVRYHEVDKDAWFVEYQFKPVFDRLKETSLPSVEVAFYRIDPTRITSISVDSSRCPTDTGDGTEDPDDPECIYISDSETLYKKPTKEACELNDGVWTDVHNLILDLCSYECFANWYDANKICTLPTIEQWEEVDPSDCSQYYITDFWSSSSDTSNDTKAWVSNCGSAGHFSFTEGKFYDDKAVRCIQGGQ